MSELEKPVVASCAKAPENLSDEAKVELIALLSKPSNVNEKEKEEQFYSSFGAWNDWDKTTEEIIAEIRGARHFRDRDVSF